VVGSRKSASGGERTMRDHKSNENDAKRRAIMLR
jgi:hypothetical protein